MANNWRDQSDEDLLLRRSNRSSYTTPVHAKKGSKSRFFLYLLPSIAIIYLVANNIYLKSSISGYSNEVRQSQLNVMKETNNLRHENEGLDSEIIELKTELRKSQEKIHELVEENENTKKYKNLANDAESRYKSINKQKKVADKEIITLRKKICSLEGKLDYSENKMSHFCREES